MIEIRNKTNINNIGQVYRISHRYVYNLESAGPNQTVCIDSLVQLAGVSPDYDSIQWYAHYTGGTVATGSFDDPNILGPLYTPSEADYDSVQVVFTMAVYQVLDSTVYTMTVTFIQCGEAPVASATIAAPFYECTSSPVQLASTGTGDSLRWYVEGGTLDDATIASPTFTPTDTSDHYYVVMVVYYLDGDSAYDVEDIELIPPPISYAGADSAVSDTATMIQFSDAYAQFVTDYYWSVTYGSGTWQNNDSLSIDPIYLFDASDVDSVVIALHVSNSYCGEVTNTMKITITAAVSNFITNGTFDDGSNWTAESGWTIGSGTATYDDVAVGPQLYQMDAEMQTSILANTAYTLSFDISGTSGGGIYMTFKTYNDGGGSATLIGFTEYTDGHYDLDFTSPADIFDGGFVILPNNAGDSGGSIDNLVLTLQ